MIFLSYFSSLYEVQEVGEAFQWGTRGGGKNYYL